MIIDLESPFKEIWNKGYLREGKDGRKRIDLVSWPERTTISYARYLLSVKYGRFLDNNEEADHKDGDRTNDQLDNLQLLSTEDHRTKTKQESKGLTLSQYSCCLCGVIFERRPGHVNGKNVFCSRSCNARYNRANNSWVGNWEYITEDQHNEIVKYRTEGLSDYKISELMGISRSKIQKYRKQNNIS